jgi:signal transduction histidine kinase
MRERAAEVGGDVMIVEGDGGGTTVLARLPVDVSLLAVGRS